VTVQAQIIRFPVERCRPRKRPSAGIAALMLAPMHFYLEMASALVTPQGMIGADAVTPVPISLPSRGSLEPR
jgi:hypothetical protein